MVRWVLKREIKNKLLLDNVRSHTLNMFALRHRGDCKMTKYEEEVLMTYIDYVEAQIDALMSGQITYIKNMTNVNIVNY